MSYHFHDSTFIHGTKIEAQGIDGSPSPSKDNLIVIADSAGTTIATNRFFTGVATGAGSDYGYDVEIADNGIVYYGGVFTFKLHTNASATDSIMSKGYEDGFVTRLRTSDNAHPWTAQIGSADYEAVLAMDLVQDTSIVVTGYVSDTCYFTPDSTVRHESIGKEDLFVAKYDTSGNLLWMKAGGSTGNDRGNGIVVDASRNIYITGSFDSTFTFMSETLVTGGNFDPYLMKLDPSGNLVWLNQLSGPGFDLANDIALRQDGSGNVIITGYFQNQLDFGGTTLYTLDASDIQAFFAMYDPSGNLVWVNTVGGGSLDEGFCINSDASGAVYGAGLYNGTTSIGGMGFASFGGEDLFFMRMGPNGEVNTDEPLEQHEEFVVYPNPCVHTLKVHYETRNSEQIALRVVNSAGVEVFQRSLGLNPGTNLLQIPVNNLSNGIYYLEVTSATRARTKPFVVTK